MKSSAVLLHGEWSPIRKQHSRPVECQELQVDKAANAIENNELLKLIPRQRLPVHEHLQRQLERERQDASSTGTQSRDKERANSSDSQPCPSLLSERKFHKIVSISVDSTESDEGR